MKRAIFPGTFDPIHYGHIDLAVRATNLFDELIVAVYDKPLKNLIFRPEERLALTAEAFIDNPKIRVTGFSCLTVEFCRKMSAMAIVRGLRFFSDFEHEFRMAHANHRLAPEIEYLLLITSEEYTFLSSTIVREIASLGGDVSSMVPTHIDAALRTHFQTSPDDRDGRHMTSLRD
ncbi:MAG: pantetheine-phosphate adenylyltransferase [Anaerolineales bacterium]